MIETLFLQKIGSEIYLNMKRIAWLFALVLSACSANPGILLQPGDTFALNEGWTLSRSAGKENYAATVPSTVAGVLDQAGYFGKDLMVGRNYADVDKTVFDDTWIYKTTFPAPKGPHTDLVFDGLDYRADIFLNGKQIASADSTFGPFRKYVYDVTSLLKGRNTLEVRLQRARPGDLNLGFVDWNPRPIDESMGIVRPVTLHTTGAVSIEDVFVIPNLDTETLKQADLEVRVTLRNHENKPVEGTLALELAHSDTNYGTASLPVALDAGETRTVTLTPSEAALLHLDNPRVWWTHDLGTPELYTLKTCIETGGALSDKKDTEFGVRKIESRLTADNYRQFTLNGKDILLKGAGWTDDIFLRDTPESLSRQVEYVRDMNLNLIRFENIWGKDDLVYDLCDRLGVMALVGFSCQWEWEDYCGLPEVRNWGCINIPETEDLAVDYFRDQVIRLHNHASVIAWMTGSDRIPNPGLEERYMEIYRQQEYRPYVNSAKNQLSTVSGWSGSKMEGPYEYVAPNYWYLDTKAGGAFGWNTETGIGANLPQLGSLRRMIPQDKLWPLSEDWDYHCTASSSAMNKTKVLQETITGLYGGFDGLEDFVRKAHAVDYDGTRAMFEAFRVRVPKTTGIVQWMLNSAWPSLYWQLYDWYGVPTAGYYGTKKACEPVQLLFDYAERKVYAVNEGRDKQDLVAEVKVYDIASNLIGKQSRTVSVGYRDVVPAFDLRRYDGKPHYVALTLTTPDGAPVADNFYALPARDSEFQWDKTGWYVTPITRYADLGFVFSGKKADLELTVDGDRITVTNKSDVIAPMVILEAKDADGQLIAPAYWSDNFFAMLPGQSKTVSCKTETTDVHFEISK